MDFAWVVDALRRGLKVTHEELPVWPEVNADGYARMSNDSDVVVHDGVYRSKKKPAAGYISLSSEKETRLPNNPSYDDEQATTRLGATMTVEEYQKVHSGEPVCESYPALKKVWTTFYDLDIQTTGTMVNKEDYPYTLCERDVWEQHGNKVVVLAEPGFSQRTVTLTLTEDCWDNARSASADLVHRVATRYGWNMEFFISLLKSVDTTKGDYNKECHGAGSATLGQQFAEDMEYWAQESAKVMHRLHYIVTQYINLVRRGVGYGTKHD